MKGELNSEVCMLNADVISGQIKVHCRHFLCSFFSFSLTTLCSKVVSALVFAPRFPAFFWKDMWITGKKALQIRLNGRQTKIDTTEKKIKSNFRPPLNLSTFSLENRICDSFLRVTEERLNAYGIQQYSILPSSKKEKNGTNHWWRFCLKGGSEQYL